MADIYNRYAFISINIVDKPEKELFKLTVSDAYTIDVTPEQLEQLGVTLHTVSERFEQTYFRRGTHS